MKLMSILSGKGFVMYNKSIAKSISVNGAIIFGQLCSSYESFGSKNMLTLREGKEYFFLTSEVLFEETSLTYKQQLRASRELEVAGYIETKVMGVPSKKFFHITKKIERELLSEETSRSDKREELNTASNTQSEPVEDDSSYDKREYLAITKDPGKVVHNSSAIKEKKKKEKDKNNNSLSIDNYKELDANEFKILLTNECNARYSKFAPGRYSKKQWNTLIKKFVEDTIESGRYKNVPRDKIQGYAFKSLEKISGNTDYKYGELEEYREIMKELFEKPVKNGFYNWLDQ